MSAKFPRGGGSRTFFSSKSICKTLKRDNTKILMTNGRLMRVESIAECSPSFKNQFVFFLRELSFYTGFTACPKRLMFTCACVQLGFNSHSKYSRRLSISVFKMVRDSSAYVQNQKVTIF